MNGAVGTPPYSSNRGSRAGSRGSPEGSRTAPAPGSLHGSRGSLQGSRASLTQGSVNGDPNPLNIDPTLINPADTIPSGGPQDVPPISDEYATFEGLEEPKSKSKKEGKGGVADKFRGSLNRVKGLFTKGPKQATGVTGPGIEEYDDDGLGSQEYLDKIETPGSSGGAESDPEKQAQQTAIQKFQNFFKKAPQMASPSVYQPGDIMQLKERPPKSKFTVGNFINVLLLSLMFAGFIMCTCISVEPALYYLGPACLGLSSFALVGKCFFTLFWEEDPVPYKLRPALTLCEKYLGGVKDPYGHKKYGKTIQKPVMTYYGPMSFTTRTDVLQMEPSNEPTPGHPKMYDESIDTRLRFPSPAPSNNPSYSSRQQSPVPYATFSPNWSTDQQHVNTSFT